MLLSAGDEVTAITRALDAYTVKELKALLAERRLPVSGKKDDLVERLEAFLDAQEGDDEDGEGSGSGSGSDEDDDEDENDENEDENKPAVDAGKPARRMVALGKGRTFGLSLALQPTTAWRD